MAELKTKRNDADVEAFLQGVEDEKRREDCLALLKLMREVTGDEPAMWGGSIVGFGSYHYKYPTGREGDWFKVGFSPRKQNLTLYVVPCFEGYETLMEELGKYKSGKSCIYAKRLEDLHLPTLKKLIKKSIKALDKQYGS